MSDHASGGSWFLDKVLVFNYRAIRSFGAALAVIGVLFDLSDDDHPVWKRYEHMSNAKDKLASFTHLSDEEFKLVSRAMHAWLSAADAFSQYRKDPNSPHHVDTVTDAHRKLDAAVDLLRRYVRPLLKG